MATDVKRVDATPEKEFFISMLVKDIELIPAIADLVDNSVDSARAARPSGNYAGLRVTLDVEPNRFEIRDNCNGISVTVARKYAFRFGRPEAFKPSKGAIGQFGVGMKRAIFKIGRAFRVESATKTSRFTMDVDVDEWAADEDPDWSFRLRTVEESIRVKSSDVGTRIEVTRLHKPISEDFQRQEMLGRLRSQISLQHQEAIEAGLEITVNTRKLAAQPPTLMLSKLVRPINTTVKIKENGGVVTAHIIAGVAPPKPRDEKEDDADAEAFKEPSDAGWYIFCNERLVVAADRSDVTGWGVAQPAYHPQYRRFRGYLYLSSDDPSLLPWNTTKTGIDRDSEVFRAVQQPMFTAAQNVAVVLNRMKHERQLKEDVQVVNDAMRAASPTPIDKLPKSDRFIVPEAPRTSRRPGSNQINVQYKAPRDLMKKVMDALDAPSASDAGRRTFDYFVESEIE